jgi:diguanylate cyclase (GGDEF)-like protein
MDHLASGMLHVDVLSGYFICGASSLVGAAMLRVAETNDARALRALRTCGFGFVILGLGLMPAGLGLLAAHPAAQLCIALGVLAGMLLIGQGLGRLQGRSLPRRWALGTMACVAALLAGSLTHDAHLFGVMFAAALTLLGALMAWLVRGMIARPRDITERALGITMIGLVVSCAARLVFTWTHDGPARVDLMYVPPPWNSTLAALYGVLPMIVSTLLLNLVNARLRQQLRLHALTDELTGTMTRRALRELAPALLQEQQRRPDGEVAVLMLDLDRFKAINDNHGHATGDAVLRLAAAVLQSQMRGGALLARYGGEEFVALVPVHGLPEARRMAERLRQAVQDADWRGRLQLEAGITVSVGVAIVGPGEPLDAALRRADEALYRAKRDGRNQCQIGLAVA